MDNVIPTRWVVGRWDGQQAKRIISLANEGIGYFILEDQSFGRQTSVVAAFRQTDDQPLEPHLNEINDPIQISKLENKRARRINAN